MELFDSLPDRFNGQLARIDRPAILQRAPDERLADLRLAARPVLARPAAVEQVQVDVARVPVRIEIGARPERGQQRTAHFRPPRTAPRT